MEEPFTDSCQKCRDLVLRRDSLKHSMRTLEEILERKRRNLEVFINQHLLTELIHHQIRLIEHDQTTMDLITKTLANCYTEYGNHLMNDHEDDGT